MATHPSQSTQRTTTSYFETQRAALVLEIGQSLEHVLQSMNKLNRSLEGVIAVGNEFSSVEALWSQFENVMGREPEEGGATVEGAAGGAAEGSQVGEAEEGGEESTL